MSIVSSILAIYYIRTVYRFLAKLVDNRMKGSIIKRRSWCSSEVHRIVPVGPMLHIYGLLIFMKNWLLTALRVDVIVYELSYHPC